MLDRARQRAADEDEQPLILAVPFKQAESLSGRGFRGTWFSIGEEKIEPFADAIYATHNPIDAALEGYPKGMVEGFHLLAMLDHLMNPLVYPTDERWFGWNYGLDRVRWLSPVIANERIRVKGTVEEVQPRDNGFVLLLHCIIEVDGRQKPAMVADWRVFWLPAPAFAAEGQH